MNTWSMCTVSAMELSDEATLSALSLSDGGLSPAFMSDRTEYNARVGKRC